MYVTPYMELHHAALDGYLMETSFPNNGGHTKADDDGQVLNAKQNRDLCKTLSLEICLYHYFFVPL